MELILGIVTGFIFGFLLQKARVLRFEKQVGFLQLKDMTILKFMLSAVLVGMMGIYFFQGIGMIDLKLKATVIGANVIGGLIFGVGWAVLGYCPGTSVGAIAEGRWHAVWGILGMLAGAALYAELYPAMKSTVLTWGDFGKITLPEIVHLSPWLIIAVFVLVGTGLFHWFEKKEI
jgi:hypothetical protein